MIGVSLWLPSSPDLDYAIWGVLGNKTNATSHPNIGSLKIHREEKWNKMSESEIILNACKSFRTRMDTIIEKKMVAILSKLIGLCLSSYFAGYFLNLKLILFYNWVIFYHTTIFLILLPHPVFKMIFKQKICFAKTSKRFHSFHGYFTMVWVIYQFWTVVFHCSLSNGNFPQISRTLLSILADLNNAVIWMVLLLPLISISPSVSFKSFLIAPSAATTTGITVTFIFLNFFPLSGNI